MFLLQYKIRSLRIKCFVLLYKCEIILFNLAKLFCFLILQLCLLITLILNKIGKFCMGGYVK